MADGHFAKHALRKVIAQVCQNIGWHAVHSSPMDILVDVLQRYISEIAKSVHQYSNQYNRTDPNLDDLGLTFKDFGIVLQEVEEYVNNVESVPPLYKVPEFPVKHPPNLQHPKSESRELLLRPEHIPSYLPLMHPDLEEDVFSQQSSVDGVKKNSDSGACGDSPSPLSSPKHGLKRNDWPGEPPNKKARFFSEEEGRPMREVTSVFMTPAGFVSPVHEGKTADSSLPCLVDSPPPTPELPSHSFASVSVKKDVKFKDLKKDKSSKSRKDKDSNKKDLKKLKSKKEKENKENAVNKHEKAVTSSSSKKEHSSHKSNKVDKSMKSDEPVRPKSKSDKMKLKAHKDEIKKAKESFKLNKMKSKLKHSGGASSTSHIKSSSSKKLKAAKVSKSIKHLKGERTKFIEPPTPLPPPVPKEVPVEAKLATPPPPSPPPPPSEPKIQRDVSDDLMDDDDFDFREESEERLVIDDSIETQARQEKESRLEVIDECIDAVIRRGKEESDVENKAMDDTINAVVKGSPPMKMMKLEAKDIYDFTDTSDSSSLSSCDIAPHSPAHTSPKKDKRSDKKSSESPKRSKKEKSKKKGSKETKAKSPTPYSSPKGQKSSSFMLRVDDRTPSPILKDDLLSSDGSTPSSSPRSNSFFDHSPPASINPPFAAGGSGYSASPFAAMRNLPSCQSSPFPTPPLFASKAESGSTFQNVQPLNLAKGSAKSSPEKPEPVVSQKPDHTDLIKKAANIIDKSKGKDSKKDKVKKKGKKDSDKIKDRKDKEDNEEEKKKTKAKEKPKIKAEKIKIDKKKSKPEKKKIKEEKTKEDTTVPKMTVKFGTGSPKISFKPNTKNSTSLSSSNSPSHDLDDDDLRTPTPPPHSPTPSPIREVTPPRDPSPSPSPIMKEDSPPPVPPPPITKPQQSRGRGRGKKAAAASPAVLPPARTVITETLGTIVDESGNKIWICPACSRADDGSPMIGCDECDDWYHWVCVGIVVPPKEEENWFCVRCIAKRQGPNIKRRRKKHKKDK